MRAAARRSQGAISSGRWYQLESGYQKAGGHSIPVGTTAATVAAAAKAVGWDVNEALGIAGFEAVDMPDEKPSPLLAITDEELAAEFLRRMRGARSGLESAPQSSIPSQTLEDEEEGYDEIDLALPPPEIRHVPETTTVMPDLLEDPEDLGGLAGGPGVGRDVEEDGPDAAAQ